MVNKVHLLNQLVRIEIYNLKNICPFFYKITQDNYVVPLKEYCLKVDSKLINNNYITNQMSQLSNSYYLNTDNKIIHNNEVDKPICLSRLYFLNGYNKYVNMLSHIDSKYKYNDGSKCDK